MQSDPQPSGRGGFTLVELLIVVAILAVVLGLAVPSLRKFSEKGELLDAARQLRAKLLAARLAAIESGGPAYFQYQLGGGSFAVVTPQAAGPDGQAAVSPLLDEPAGAMPEEAVQIEDAAVQTLPAAIRFVEVPASEGTLSVESADAVGGEWSSPVTFYPNGRALNAQIRLATAGYQVDLTVRGLTGTVQISPPQRIVVAADQVGDQEALP